MAKTATKKKSTANKNTANTSISKETYLEWYELMYRIRRFEEMCQRSYMQQKVRGFLHVYIGQEAIAAAIHSASRVTDPLITGYRCHGLGIMRGISTKQAMAELYGKKTGNLKGNGGSMHFFNKEQNFYGGHGIVGGQIGLGAGLGFAEMYKGTDNASICLFGDGAARQGILHETFNMAMTWKIPTVFVCENNKYAMGTSVERTTNVTDMAKIGDSYEMPSENVDGMDAVACHEAFSRALAHCRSGKGPYYLNIETYRYKGHSVSDPQKYRTKEEVEEYKSQDPIETTKQTILKNKWATEEQLDQIVKDIRAEIEEALEFAENSPFPDGADIYDDAYSTPNYPFVKD